MSGDKVGNKKQLKMILATDCEKVYACKIIHRYFEAKIDCPSLIESLLSTIKS
jgi:hypothetical protein